MNNEQFLKIKTLLQCLVNSSQGSDPCCPQTNLTLEDINTVLNTTLTDLNDNHLELIQTIKDKKDFELIIMCDEATGNPIVVKYSFDDTGELTVTKTDAVTELPFTGTLSKCPNKNYGITSKEWFCLNGTDKITREDIVDFDTNTTVTSIWRDITGAVITTPVTGTYVQGPCDIQELTSVELFERFYTPAQPFINGNFADPSTTTQTAWTQISGTELWTFSGGVATVPILSGAPNYPTLAHSTYFVNPGKVYTLSFEARGIDNTPPIGSIASTLLVGVDGVGPSISLVDNVWRTYTHQFTTNNLGVSIGFSRDLTSQGLQIRNVQVTQNGGDYTCVPFLRNFDGTTFNNTKLDFVTPYTVTDETKVSLSCTECDCLNITNETVEYSTTFAYEVLTTAFTVPVAPLNTKEVVIFNDSNSRLVFSTNKGTQVVAPGGTIEFSVNDYETGITFGSITVLSGTFDPGDVILLNYKIIV